MIKFKTTLVLCCEHSDCNYGCSGCETIEVQGLVTIPHEIDLDRVPGTAEVMTTEFVLPEGWQANWSETEFRCPKHHEELWT